VPRRREQLGSPRRIQKVFQHYIANPTKGARRRAGFSRQVSHAIAGKRGSTAIGMSVVFLRMAVGGGCWHCGRLVIRNG
jgi:hypothetical protein